MQATEQILNAEMEAIKAEFIIRYEELKMRASGKWADELQASTTQTENRYKGTIEGVPYTKYLVDGRPPSDKMPPIAVIEQWIKDKGIAPVNDKLKLSSLAFLIARKIAREGTTYYKEGGTDLVDSVITPERIQTIIDKVKILEVNFLVQHLQHTLKTFHI